MHGQFVWYELTTPDVDAARKFYPQFTGWSTQQFDKDYSLWTTGGAPFAGLFRLSEALRQAGTPPNWLPYIEANSVDDTATLAASIGGKIVHGPEDIPNTGRFALLQDPQGANFGIYKANGPSRGWDGNPVVGRFSWHELMTTDYKKAFDFYRRLFGWNTMQEMDMGGGNMYSMFGKQSKHMFGAVYNRMSEMASVPPNWLLYINVKDIKKAVDTAVKAGAKLQRDPMEVPGGSMIAILADPQGAAFAVHQSAPAEVAKPAAKKAAKAVKKSRAKRVAAKKSPAKKAAKRSAKKATRKKATARKSVRRKATSKKAARKKSARRPASRGKRRARGR